MNLYSKEQTLARKKNTRNNSRERCIYIIYPENRDTNKKNNSIQLNLFLPGAESLFSLLSLSRFSAKSF